MLYKPISFNEVKGNKDKVEYIRKRIATNSFPPFTLFHGDVGLGKSTLAKLSAMGLTCKEELKPCGICTNCKAAIERVIKKNESTKYIKIFNMSINGGKEASEEIIVELQTNMLTFNEKKVLILDEGHSMEKAAQDMLLPAFEHLPDNILIIMCTSNTANLQKALVDRALTVTLYPLTKSEMLQVLRNEVERKGLKIKGGNATLELIATWAEYRPRHGLKILEAFKNGEEVSDDLIKEFIDFRDTEEFIKLLESFRNSILDGIEIIDSLSITDGSIQTLLTVTKEAVKLAYGKDSYKLGLEDTSKLKHSIDGIQKETLTMFLYTIANIKTLNKQNLLASYLKNHNGLEDIKNADKEETLRIESGQMIDAFDMEGKVIPKAPSIDSLLRAASVIE